MEDVLIGRQTKVEQFSIDTTPAMQTLINVNADRISCIISPLLTDTLIIQIPGAPTATGGILLKAGAPPLTLDIFTHGIMVRGPINVAGVAGGEAAVAFCTILQRQK